MSETLNETLKLISFRVETGDCGTRVFHMRVSIINYKIIKSQKIGNRPRNYQPGSALR